MNKVLSQKIISEFKIYTVCLKRKKRITLSKQNDKG